MDNARYLYAILLERATTDFDIIDVGYSPKILSYTKLLGQVDFLDLNMTTIDIEFANRSNPIEGLKYIKVFTASREDLITYKIGRYSSKDKEDIAQLLNEADIELLVHLCKMIEKRTDLSQMLKDKFIINCAKFAKEFLDV